MSGKKKVGLDFFYHDVQAFQDLKIRKLIKRKGSAAYTVYICLLCEIYRHGYYIEFDEELPFFISEQTGSEEVFCLDIIKTCVSIGLFDAKMVNRYHILTSQRIQEHYASVSKAARRIAKIDKFNLLQSSEKKASSSAKMDISSEDKAISSAKMVLSANKVGRNGDKKKSKVKEIKETSPSIISPSLQAVERKEEGIINNNPSNEPQRIGTPYFALVGALKGKIGEPAEQEDETIWELMRLTSNGRTDSMGVAMAIQWLNLSDDDKKHQPFYTILQALQAAEKKGKIQCEPYKLYHTKRWLRLNIGRNEYHQAEALLEHDSSLINVCQDCIREIKTKGDAIKFPGKFILSRMKEQK